jgi:CheY-like chemotaxis protein
MRRNGPIVIVDDDEDDIDIMQMAIAKLNLTNETKFFSSTKDALEYIQKPDVVPFIILSDINMPGQNGFAFRNVIKRNQDLDVKCIPFLFITTGATEEVVSQAYAVKAQGVFQKPPSLTKWSAMLQDIVDYWTECMAPGSFKAGV